MGTTSSLQTHVVAIDRYDIIDCQFYTEYEVTLPRPSKGLKRILEVAEQLGVDPREAVTSRLRYLQTIEYSEEEAKQLLNYLNGKSVSSNYVTEDMKEYAHTLDVSVVLDYADIKYNRNGMLKCPFHDDRSESASIRKGVLICFAGCRPTNSNKECFDAVALYRQLFDAGYYDAGIVTGKHLMCGHTLSYLQLRS